MSGGSYGYLFSRGAGVQGDGFLDGLLGSGDQMLSEAEQCLARYVPYEHDRRKGQPLTDEERELARVALEEVRSLMAILRTFAAHWEDPEVWPHPPLRGLLHEIEYCASGDSGPDDVVQALIAVGRTRKDRATLRLVTLAPAAEIERVLGPNDGGG
jgi:hypothetical protein